MSEEFFCEVMDVPSEEKKQWAIRQLQCKAQQLGRVPKKEDFDEQARSRIKAFLGPWPRALEAAGLKDVRPRAHKGHPHTHAAAAPSAPDADA